MKPHRPILRAALGLALLGAGSAAPAAAAEPLSAQRVEAILGGLRTGPAAFERTVIVDSRSVGSGFDDLHLHARYTEIQHRESARRARVVYGTAEHAARYTVTRHDGEVFLATGGGPARRTGGPLLRLLRGMVPVPVRAEDVAHVDTMSTSDGGSRVLVRFTRPDPSRTIGRDDRDLPARFVARATRVAEETAELRLGPDGGLIRLTQRYRATLDGAALTPGIPMLGPLGTIRLRLSSTLNVTPSSQVPVNRPVATGTVTDEAAFQLMPGESPVPTLGPSRRNAAPWGNARAIALARRANAAFRGMSAFTSALRATLPGASGVVRVQVGLRHGLVHTVRTSLGADAEVVSMGRWQFIFDPFGRCWVRVPLSPDPVAPWEPGRAPIPLRGSRFFAPKPTGRLVRIVAQRALGDVPIRMRFTLDRRTGRLLAVEGFLTKGRVIARPRLTVAPPTPVC